MVQYNPLQYLPTAEELPDSDDTPVDNELQILIPILLRAILALLWADRMDWFFGVNMGVYYEPDKAAIVPDGFLSLGVERYKAGGKLRLSYVLWQENNTVPQWVLEVVSKTPGNEYDDKMTKYAQIGVLYCVIYNPDYWRRDKHEPFEVCRLVNGIYERQTGNPVWMSEIELGIGCEVGTYEGCTREWLYWYNQQGDRFPTPGILIEQEQQRAQQSEQRAEQERQRAERLAERLRQMGVNPDKLD
jgi:Uma2 family endonuclease